MSDDGAVECPTCGRKYSGEHGVKVHHYRAHNKSIAGTTVECDHCGEQFQQMPSRAKSEGKNYCSEKCLIKDRSPTKDELVGELVRLRDELGRIPRQKDLKQRGEYSRRPYDRKFDKGWNGALRAAGLETNYENRTEEDCLEDIRNTANKTGYVPTTQDHTEYGTVSVATILRKFDSWRDAIADAGLDSSKVRRYDIPESEKKGHRDYGPNWREQKQKARQRDDNSCQSCGMSSEKHKEKWGMELHVHHLTPAREFDDHEERNKLSNLITLCAACHRRWESMPIQPQVAGGAD